MAKYKTGSYCQIYNRAIKILNEHNEKIPYSAKWLYTHLCWLEHKYTGKKEDYFFRSIDDLQEDIKMGRKQVIKGIKILEGLNLIQTWQMHWNDPETGKKSEKHITAFRILDV